MCDFKLRVVGDDFMNNNGWRKWVFSNSAEIDATSEEVFKVLTTTNSWKDWFPEIVDVNWTTPDPKSVGTTRTIRFYHWLFALLLFGTISVNEYFFKWEENKRITFYVTSISRPTILTFNALLEDYNVEDLGNGKSKFTYTVYAEPGFLTWSLGFLYYVARGIFTKGPAGLKVYIETTVKKNPANTGN